jgi:O-antigen ligase
MVPVGLVLAGRLRLLNALLITLVVLLLVATLVWTGVIPQDSLETLAFSHRHYYTCWAGLDFFLHNPVVGVGPGRYYENAIPWGFRHGHYCGYNAPNNDYIHLLCEGGLVGFLLGLGAALQLFRVLKQFLAKEDWHPMRLVLLAFLTQAIAFSLTMSFLLAGFGRPAWVIPNSALLAGLLGAIWTNKGGFLMSEAQTGLQDPGRE